MNAYKRFHVISIIILGLLMTSAPVAQARNSAVVPPPGPLVWFNTFLGGSNSQYANAMARDANGNLYVAGYSDESFGSPIRPFGGVEDAVVAKFSANGALQWMTFLGGTAYDEAFDMKVDASGNIYVIGKSYATWGSPQNPFGVSFDAFIAKLNTNGVLQWNTFTGGASEGQGIDLDDLGNIYAAGYTNHTWGSPINPIQGVTDIFAAKFNNDGALQWNTFIGSTTADFGADIARDSSGNLFVLGQTQGTWGVPVNPYVGNWDTYVAKLNPNGVLQWNTFMGGTGSDFSKAIAVDESGDPYLIGESNVAWGTPVNPLGGDWDGFVARLDRVTGARVWNTFFGGTGFDMPNNIEVSGGGTIYLTGLSEATWGSPRHPFQGDVDAVVVALSNSGARQWNTFVGGSDFDFGVGIALSPDGDIFLAGGSSASWGSPLNPHAGLDDILLVKVAPILISGNAGVAGAVVSYDQNGPQTVTADENGDYVIGVPGGWTGTITPSKTYYTFAPASRDYSDVQADQGSENFTATLHTFNDVPVAGKEWMEPWINAFYNHGITTGCGSNPRIYCPENNVTRAEMAVFLLRAKHGAGYVPPAATGIFTDVPVTGKEWMQPWIEQFYREGITTGCGANPMRYCPEQNVTRAEMAVFVLRSTHAPGWQPPAATGIFTDVPVAGKAWMQPWIEEYYREGITSGCGAGPIYCPENSTTRAEMAVFIGRAYHLYP